MDDLVQALQRNADKKISQAYSKEHAHHTIEAKGILYVVVLIILWILMWYILTNVFVPPLI